MSEVIKMIIVRKGPNTVAELIAQQVPQTSLPNRRREGLACQEVRSGRSVHEGQRWDELGSVYSSQHDASLLNGHLISWLFRVVAVRLQGGLR